MLTPRFPPSKFAVPQLVSRLVPRSRLFETLDRGAGRQLTMVVGAPGAGKTTLLASWVSRRAQIPGAWLSCHAEDNEPSRFMCALIDAMRRGFGQPTMGENALELLSIDGEVSRDVVGAFSDDLEELGGTRILAIDDLHLIGDASAEAFGQFLESRPLSLQVVVATRSDPPLRLHRMRAREQLVELRDHELAFSTDEAKGFFAGFGVDLADGDVEDVQRRTEGWSTGLHLAALSIQAASDRKRSVRGAEVHSHTVAGYFLEEVLYQQPADVVDFMLSTSVLDELSVPACAALVGDGAGAILDHLTNAHLFVTVVDEHARTYRFHHLIREVLQAELHRRDPKREAALHEAAARYLLDDGHAAAAAKHLLAAGDSESAFRLLSDRVVRDVLTNPTVGSALDLDDLRPELFAGVPEVLVPLAAELLWRGAFERGARAVTLARQAPVDPLADAALAVRYALVNTLYCTFVGELDEALVHRDWARTFETTVSGVDDWIVTLDALAMYCNTYLGSFREARSLAESLVARSTSGPLTDLLCSGVISQAALLEGIFDEAEGLAESTLAAAKRLRFEQHFFVFHALRTLGQLALERRELEAAIEPVEIALGMVSSARPAFNFLAQLDRARIWAASGNREEALASLPAARSALRSRDAVLLADADELEAKLRLSLGDPQGARRAAELLRSPRQHVVDAIIALAAGEVDAAEQALDKLVGTELTVRTEVELQLLRANVAVLRSASDTAQVVRRALDNAQRHGFVQTVLDTAPQLLDHVVANPHLYPHSNDLGRLLAAHLDAQKASGARPRRSPLIEPLTTAEMRVLSRLSEHLSNSEIASELYVSLNTVKTHVKHIYLKLDVNTRSEALSRAAALGLVR